MRADGEGEEAGGALAGVRASNSELRGEVARHKAELEELKRKARLSRVRDPSVLGSI